MKPVDPAQALGVRVLLTTLIYLGLAWLSYALFLEVLSRSF